MLPQSVIHPSVICILIDNMHYILYVSKTLNKCILIGFIMDLHINVRRKTVICEIE